MSARTKEETLADINAALVDKRDDLHPGYNFVGTPDDWIIAAGFGSATVSRDGACILDGDEWVEQREEYLTFADAERMAAADPDHVWTVTIARPLHGETYTRRAAGVWECTESNEGFA